MAHNFLFADEAGDFAFKTGQNISKYYVVCTVTMSNCEIGEELMRLRRKLAWKNAPLRDFFHATSDKQEIRDEVFSVLANHKFEVQATIMEKRKAMPRIRPTEERFYQYGWHYHFQHSSEKYVTAADTLMITVASIGTKKKRINFEDAIRDVVNQKLPRNRWRVSFWPCQTDPCLQVADYCTWAIQRKWESGGKDARSYDLIRDRINYEYELFQHGTTYYYE